MSFTRKKTPPRTIDFTCDGCSSEFIESEEFDLGPATTVARRAGWAVAKVEDEYLHHCRDCSVRLGTA